LEPTTPLTCVKVSVPTWAMSFAAVPCAVPARRSTVTPSSACAYEICVPPLPVEYELCVPLLPVMVSLPPPPSKVLFMLYWI